MRGRGAGISWGVWLSRTVSGKGLFRLLVTGDIKVKVQTRVGISSLPLKAKPSRSPLGASLIPQTRYNSVLLNNQSFFPLKVPLQPMALLSQAFNRARSLGSFATGSIQQRCFITQLFPSCPQLVFGQLQLIPDYLKLNLSSLQPVPGLQQVILGGMQPVPDFSKLDLGHP